MIELKKAAFNTWPTVEGHDAITIQKNLSHLEIDAIEAFHIERNTHPRFRLISSRAYSNADEKLAKRGYMRQGGVVVMTGSLTTVLKFTPPHESLDDALMWLQACRAISKPFHTEQKAHLSHLLGIQATRSLAVLHRDEQPVCRGLGVLTADALELWAIATHPDYQKQGLATQLCSGLMMWGKAQGAKSAVLHVPVHHPAAINLSERLGFQQRYQYWYRVHPLHE